MTQPVRCDYLLTRVVFVCLWNDNESFEKNRSSSIFPQVFNFISFISSSEEKARRFYVFEKTRQSCCISLWEKQKYQVINFCMKVRKIVVDLFWFWYSTKPFQINVDIINEKTLWKVTSNLKQQHRKNYVNFITRHEICRVWDVSLSHYPSQHLSVFGNKKLITERSFATLWETVFRKPRKESVSKWKNRDVASKSNLINLQFNLPPGVVKNTTNL